MKATDEYYSNTLNLLRFYANLPLQINYGGVTQMNAHIPTGAIEISRTLAGLIERRSALLAIAPIGWPDDAMNGIMTAVSAVEDEIWSTPPRTPEDVGAKMRILLEWAEDKDVIAIRGRELLSKLADEWLAANKAEIA